MYTNNDIHKLLKKCKYLKNEIMQNNYNQHIVPYFIDFKSNKNCLLLEDTQLGESGISGKTNSDKISLSVYNTNLNKEKKQSHMLEYFGKGYRIQLLYITLIILFIYISYLLINK